MHAEPPLAIFSQIHCKKSCRCMAAPTALAWDFTATVSQALSSSWAFLLGTFVANSRSIEVVCKFETSPDDKVLGLLQRQLERCGPSQLSAPCPECAQCHLPMLLLAAAVSSLVCLVLGFLLGSAFHLSTLVSICCLGVRTQHNCTGTGQFALNEFWHQPFRMLFL